MYIREPELAHRRVAVSHGEADVAREQRALPLALLHDALLELVGGPVLTAVRREVPDDRDQLHAQHVRVREGDRRARDRVHEDDLQWVAAGALDPVILVDRELQPGPEDQTPPQATSRCRAASVQPAAPLAPELSHKTKQLD